MGSPTFYVDLPVRIRTAHVVRTTWISATTIRLTVGGDGVSGFQSRVFDEHVKLIFADPDTGDLRLPTPDGDELEWPRPFPTSREYTVRAHRPDDQEVDIDIVAHAGGLASTWVREVQPGDPVHIAGPPGGYEVPDDYEHYLLVGDETALPAMARWLDEAPRDAVGWVVIEVPSALSQIPLEGPAGVEVIWLHTGVGGGTDLYDTVRVLPIPEAADLFVWSAGEAGAIKPIRRWVRDERRLTKEQSSTTGYWKKGHTDTHEHMDED